MAIEMKATKIPTVTTREERHARQMDYLRMQCDQCKRKKPNTPTKDCDVRVKLIVQDSEVGWKHKHLFLHSDGQCKMFQPK